MKLTWLHTTSRAPGGDGLAPAKAQPVEHTDQHEDRQAQHGTQHAAQDRRRQGQRDCRKRQHEGVERRTDQGQHHHPEGRRQHHEQGIEDIVGGDHASTMVIAAFQLDQRVQRDDVEATAQADRREIEHLRQNAGTRLKAARPSRCPPAAGSAPGPARPDQRSWPPPVPDRLPGAHTAAHRPPPRARMPPARR